MYFVHEPRLTAPEPYAVFHVLRQVQSTNILKQSLIVFGFTFILFCIFKQFTWQGIMHCVKFLNRDYNSEHITTVNIYIYVHILHHRPSRWPSDIHTCCNIKDKTYLTWRNFISRINTFIIKCFFFGCCRTCHRMTGQAAAGDCKVLWNLSDETQWLGHRQWETCRLHRRLGH